MERSSGESELKLEERDGNLKDPGVLEYKHSQGHICNRF